MRLTSLSLEQFRSYDRISLDFSDTNRLVFVGENGAGKTNLVEAISFLSVGRSCLRAKPEDALRWGTDFFRMTAGTRSDEDEESSVEYVFQQSPRRQSAMFIRDVRTPLLQFIGALPTIVFLPQDLDIFTGSPSMRRSFLDVLLSQLKPDYAAKRIEYERVLKQRNAVLSRIADHEAGLDDLSLWDGRLAEIGAGLILLRDEMIVLFNRSLQKTIADLGETEWNDVRMMHDRKTRETEVAAIEAEMRQLLLAARDRDLVLCSTTVGPHRDDWHLQALGHNVSLFASRGQQRAAFIALLLTSALLFKEVRGERPVILLDDVLSELDCHHQKALLSSLEGHQVFITTTHSVSLEQKCEVWEVGEGNVRKTSS
ncbi:DNA replication and repair protein RecF [Candidatus Peribacteria bacterium]|nr:DNA replication and repair protein RecF [Candidatus Peribacteria bacterium]